MSESNSSSPSVENSRPTCETSRTSFRDANTSPTAAGWALGPSSTEMADLQGAGRSPDTAVGPSYNPKEPRDEVERPGANTSGEVDGGDPKPTLDLPYTEDLSIQKRKLTVWDVAALILNKIIGTGIFTVPGLVLGLTNSKVVSVVYWILGGFYCSLCLVIYLDYGTALPYNGGELIYLNKVWPNPKLLSVVSFSGFFITLGHTAGNAVAFARHVLLAAHSYYANDDIHFSKTMVNYIAISILIVVCLIHYFSSRMGLFLNKLLALYKVILLLIMAFAGIAARNKPGSGKSASDWTSSRTVGTGFNSVSALIYVIYSYTGWENANYVIGEIDAAPKTLRRGAFLAVTVATMTYTLVTVGYFLACSSKDIAKNQSDLGMASIFAERVFGHTMGVKVCIALSAAGNLIAVVYTSSKVKQAIALHHYLPFSSFFAADGSFGTPGGALLLHGVCSAIVVLAIPNDTDGYGFLLGLFTYGQLMIGVVIGLGFPRLAKKMGNSNPSWEPFLKNRGLVWLSGLGFTLLNLFLLISAAWPRASGYIHRYWWPATLTSVFAGSFIYWLCLRGLEARLGDWIGWKAKIVEIDHSATPFEHYQSLLRRDGAESRMTYQLQSGKLVDKLKGILKALLDLVYEWIY